MEDQDPSTWKDRYERRLSTVFDDAAKTRVTEVLELLLASGIYEQPEESYQCMLSPSRYLKDHMPFDIAAESEDGKQSLMRAISCLRDCSYI